MSKQLDQQSAKIQEQIYNVTGMHCASCEVLIENRLLKEAGIKAVEASTSTGQVMIEYDSAKPAEEKLNQVFKANGYHFSEQPIKSSESAADAKPRLTGKPRFQSTAVTFGVALGIIVVFLILLKAGYTSWITVTSASSLPMFLLFGLLAGFSSCAALVGGLVLSMSKQWQELYASGAGSKQKFQPHFLFNAGRLVAYGLLGALLGLIGQAFKLSLTWTAILVLAVSALMILLALQMLGVKYFQRFQIAMPKFATRYIADETKFKGKYMPFLLGALTFFLPCGFTLTAQALALASGGPWQGGLIMLFFALGTAPALLLIGLASVKFLDSSRLSRRFLKVAGVLVLFFALFNINSQLNVLGLKSLSDVSASSQPAPAIVNDVNLPPIVNGKQVIKMQASARGYTPNKITVRAGVPIRWEITDTGTSGCTNAVIAKDLFSGQIDLTPGQTSVKEFTIAKAGRYKFSCWMGMVSGVMEAVEVNKTGAAVPLPEAKAQAASSAAPASCSAGGSGGSGGSCGSGGCGCGGR